MRRKFILFAILSWLMLSLLGGCGTDANLPGSDTEKEPMQVTSADISIPIEKVRTLNPLLSLDEDTYYLNKLIYDGLFVLDENMQVEGNLAADYRYDEVGTSVEIRLREGVLWQDGAPFIARDVKFTIDAFHSVPSTRQGTYGPSAGLIKSVKIVDEMTVEITFADPNSATIENLTFPILPSHAYVRPGDAAGAAEGFLPMGTGPYRVSSFQEGKEIVLSGNPVFRSSIPENTLHFKFVPNREEAVNLFDIGELNMTFLRDINRNTLVEDKVVNMISFPSNEVEVLGFNFRHGALQDPVVRRAIAFAVDNQRILENCYYNSGTLNTNLFFPGYIGSDNMGALYEYDTGKATELLKQTEYEGLSLRLLFNGENHARNLAAQIIKSGLEKIGITVTLTPLTKEDYNKAVQTGDYDLYLGGFRLNEACDLRPLLHSGWENPIGYANFEMDGLLDKMQQGITREQKAETYQRLQQLYADEIPYYCLLYKTYGLAASTNLTGEIRPSFNHIYKGCENWRITYEKPTD